ncbi:MAG: cytochrome c [Myxococcota bacterium]|nr:cytochrome c [Myxococcota bacterium]
MHPTARSIARLIAVAALAIAAPSWAGDAAAGKAVYDTSCASCHGPDGKGDGPVGAVLNPPPRDFSAGDFKFDANKNGTAGEDEDLALVTRKGALTYGGSPLMAGWPTLTDEQVADVIAFIRSLKE